MTFGDATVTRVGGIDFPPYPMPMFAHRTPCMASPCSISGRPYLQRPCDLTRTAERASIQASYFSDPRSPKLAGGHLRAHVCQRLYIIPPASPAYWLKVVFGWTGQQGRLFK